MDLRKTKDYIGDRRKKLNTMRALSQGARRIKMPERQKELIPRKVCPDGSVRPSNVPCPPRPPRPRPLRLLRPGVKEPMTRAEQFKKERLGR